jgi:hypothetical protein
MVEGVSNLLADAYGYASDAIAGPEHSLLGFDLPYQAQSSLVRAIQQRDGYELTADLLNSIVPSTPGLAQLDAINRNDWNAFGASLPGGLAAAAGTSAGLRLMSASFEGAAAFGGAEPSLMVIGSVKKLTRGAPDAEAIREDFIRKVRSDLYGNTVVTNEFELWDAIRWANAGNYYGGNWMYTAVSLDLRMAGIPRYAAKGGPTELDALQGTRHWEDVYDTVDVFPQVVNTPAYRGGPRDLRFIEEIYDQEFVPLWSHTELYLNMAKSQPIGTRGIIAIRPDFSTDGYTWNVVNLRYRPRTDVLPGGGLLFPDALTRTVNFRHPEIPESHPGALSKIKSESEGIFKIAQKDAADLLWLQTWPKPE